MLTPCASSTEKAHANSQSQNSFFSLIASAGRNPGFSASVKKHPALSFSAGQPLAIPGPVPRRTPLQTVLLSYDHLLTVPFKSLSIIIHTVPCSFNNNLFSNKETIIGIKTFTASAQPFMSNPCPTKVSCLHTINALTDY